MCKVKRVPWWPWPVTLFVDIAPEGKHAVLVTWGNSNEHPPMKLTFLLKFADH